MNNIDNSNNSYPYVINPMTVNPFTQSWLQQNIPYSFPQENSSTTDAQSSYKGLNSINKNYRYLFFQSMDTYDYFMSKPSVDLMSGEITRKLEGVNPDGKNIIVPDDTILSVADSMYESYKMDIKVLQEMTINYIVSSIKTEYQITENNNKLSIWVTKYDIDSGLQRINGIKLNNKRRNNYSYWKY